MPTYFQKLHLVKGPVGDCCPVDACYCGVDNSDKAAPGKLNTGFRSEALCVERDGGFDDWPARQAFA